MNNLTSSRLTFKMLSDEFLEEFIEMDLDPEVMEFYTNRPHGKREYAISSFERYKSYMERNPTLGGFFAFSKATGEFVGLGVLIHLELNDQNDKHEVGYRLPKRSWGQGYATEICNALIDHGFVNLGMNEIYGTTHPDHVVSQKVLMKCGLIPSGSSEAYGGSSIYKRIKGGSEL